MKAFRLRPGLRFVPALLLFIAAPAWGAAVVSTGTGGNWNATGTWVGGAVPGAADDVTIADGATVTINTTTTINSLTVGQGTSGILQFPVAVPARHLTVSADVTIASGGTFRSSLTGTTTNHSVVVGGNLTNNGTLDLSTNGGNGGATIEFTGVANASFSGPGATTDIYSINMNKGTTPASILELMPANFTVQGGTTDVAGGWLVMTNGTIKLSGTFTGTNRLFAAAAYIIPASCGFWLNNPNYTVAGRNGTATNNGLLQITQGTFNVGSNNGNSLLAGADGAVFTIEGGVLNVAGRLSGTNAGTTYNIAYNQSGGTVNLRTIGSASAQASLFLVTAAQTFNMSGGTINLVQRSTAATPWDWVVVATPTITGGTLNVGTAATATNFTNFGIYGYTPNLVIDATANAKSATVLNVGQTAGSGSLLVFGDLTIGSGAGLALNGFQTTFPGLVLTNNGTLDGTVSLSALYFSRSTPQLYTGSGTATVASASNDSSVSIDNPGGVSFDAASNGILTDRLNLFTGGITNANKLTIGNAGATTGIIQIGNSGTATAAGLFDTAPTFNLGTGGEVLLYLATTAARTTGPEINPLRTLTQLVFNDAANTLTVAGGDLTVNGTAAGALALTNGRVITGPSTLYFSDTTTGTVTRATGFVDGNFKKAVAATGTKLFEVGTAAGYSPVTFNVTAGTGDITVKATDGIESGVLPVETALTRYWTLTATGFTADLTFGYLATDVPVTANEANFKLFRHDTGTFTDVGATIDTGAHTASVTGISTFSDWTLAENVAPPPTAVVSGDATICDGGSTTIQAALTGNGPWNLTWSDSFSQPGVTTSPATRVVSPSATTIYTVTNVSDTFYSSGNASGSATVTVNPIPATPTASNDGPVCEGTTLNLSTPAVTGATYAWSGPNGFTSSDQNPSIASAATAASGSYAVTVTVLGCTSPAGTTTATVNSIPAAPVPGNNGPICEGATLLLSASSSPGRRPTTAVIYAWTGPNGFTSSDQNPSIPNATPAASGTYSVTATVLGCTSPAGTTTATVNAIPATPTASNDGPICEGTTLNLTTPAVTGATYAWTGPNGFSSALQNPSIASATTAATGTYSVTVTVNGCTSPAGTTSATVNAIPVTPTASNDGPVCEGTTLDLTTPTVTGATYAWTGPNGFSSALQNPSIASATTAATGTYSVTVTVSGCTSPAATTTATVHAIPTTPVPSNDGPVCVGSPLHLTTPTVAGATYLWTDPHGFTTNVQNPTIASVTMAAGGTYSLTITVNGCTSAAGTTTVTVNAIPGAPAAGNDGPICAGATLHLTTPAVAGATYAWTGPNGFTSATQNPSITSATTAATGTYSVTVTVSGCASPAGTTSATVNADTTAPVVTPPASFTVDQSLCCGTFGGASGATSTGLNNFINGGSATDDCMATPTRLAPQISGVDVLASTCFEVGTTAVTFRYQDDAGHTGTASSNVTVRMFGDLDMNHVVDPSDMVVMRAYFNFVVTPGTAPFNAPLNMADLTHNTIVDPADLVVLRAYFNFVVSCLAPTP